MPPPPQPPLRSVSAAKFAPSWSQRLTRTVRHRLAEVVEYPHPLRGLLSESRSLSLLLTVAVAVVVAMVVVVVVVVGVVVVVVLALVAVLVLVLDTI